MRVEVTCPGCGKELRVRTEYSGRRVQCKACQFQFSVPQLTRPPEGTSALVPAPIIEFLCPGCHNPQSFGPASAGSLAGCVSCRTLFKVPARSGEPAVVYVPGLSDKEPEPPTIKALPTAVPVAYIEDEVPDEFA